MIIIKNEIEWLKLLGPDKVKSDIKLNNNIVFTKILDDKLYLSKYNFDGCGYTITYYSKHNSSCLFDLQGGEIKNVCVKCNRASLSDNNGWIVGQDSYGNIINCHTDGIISGNGNGGIVGNNFGNSTVESSIEKCSSTGNIYGQYTGGITGNKLHNCVITNCYSTGKISGSQSGGIISSNSNNCKVIGCYSGGDILGTICGGICGFNTNNIYVQECFVLGKIGNDKSIVCGGLISGISPNNEFMYVEDCYTVGNIVSAKGRTSSSGGLIGIIGCNNKKSKHSIKNCYVLGKCTNSGSIVGYILNKCKLITNNCITVNNNIINYNKINLKNISHNIDNISTTTDKWGDKWSNNGKYITLNRFKNPLIWNEYNNYLTPPCINFISSGMNGDMRIKTINSYITSMPNNNKTYVLFSDKKNNLVISYKGWNIPEERYANKLERLKGNEERYNKVKKILKVTNFIKYIIIEHKDDIIVFDLTEFVFKKYNTKLYNSNELETTRCSKSIKVSPNLKNDVGLYLLNDTHSKTDYTLNKNIIFNINDTVLTLCLSKDRSNIVKRGSIELRFSNNFDHSNSIGACINGAHILNDEL